MILSERDEWLDATAANTGGAATYLIGDVIDLEVARDIGSGDELWLVISVDTTFTSGGAGTLALQLASDAQAAIATDGTATVHVQTATFALAALVAGRVLFAGILPAEGNAYERYLGILQITGTAAFTAGKLNAFLTPDYAKVRHYADAVN